MPRKKSRKILKISVFVVVLIAIWFFYFYAPRFITEINNPLIELIRSPTTSKNSSSAETTSVHLKPFTFTSFDGTEIAAHLTRSQLDTIKGTVILLHGIRSTKEHFSPLALKLSKEGYHAVSMDLRAHGESGGTHCTFGVKEKLDVSSLIDLLISNYDLGNNIGVWGQSLGGAIAIQALGTDDRLKFGIIESTFSDFRTITNDYVNYHIGFNIEPLTNFLVDRAGKIADFKPEEARPLFYAQLIRQPILLVHGNKDKRIDMAYAKQNFKQISSEKKEFLEIKNANHLNVWQTGGDDYFNTVFQFLDNTSKEAAQ